MKLPLFLLQQSGSPASSGLVNFLPLILIVGIFYLLIYRPMRRRQKNLESMIAGLKTGDKIITTGGIYGTVVGIRDTSVLVKISEQVKIEVAKSAVAALQSPPADSETR